DYYCGSYRSGNTWLF
nr:immunoglobulin light chain junction region [Macaca mulatta]MOW58304.1 immunoglobulin light chain junction region [Macaca mulatta]MOW58790.1 immunoglobulin light chain junction region [Macaca mulatta]